MRDPCFRSTPALPTKIDRPDPTGPARRPYLTSSTSSVLRLQTLDVEIMRKHVYSPLVASEAAHVRCARGPVLDSMPRGRCVEPTSGCAREGVISSVRSRRVSSRRLPLVEPSRPPHRPTVGRLRDPNSRTTARTRGAHARGGFSGGGLELEQINGGLI